MTLLELLRKKRKALVLAGPQGCGKTLLARQLAKDVGNYVEISVEEIIGKQSRFTPWLQDSPNVVIINGELKYGDLLRVTPLIVQNDLQCNCVGKEPKTVKAPIFIFCTTNVKDFDIYPHIFNVMEMSEL